VPADGIWTAYKRDFGTSRQSGQLKITMASGLDKRVVLMSAIGTKQTWGIALHMSAFGGKEDIAIASQNVR
jgi:hypothetical protein